MWKGERESMSLCGENRVSGDQIIFLGLLPEVKEMCDTLWVYVDPRLQTLCRQAMQI